MVSPAEKVFEPVCEYIDMTKILVHFDWQCGTSASTYQRSLNKYLPKIRFRHSQRWCAYDIVRLQKTQGFPTVKIKPRASFSTISLVVGCPMLKLHQQPQWTCYTLLCQTLLRQEVTKSLAALNTKRLIKLHQIISCQSWHNKWAAKNKKMISVHPITRGSVNRNSQNGVLVIYI